jgi:hypothetical protein
MKITHCVSLGIVDCGVEFAASCQLPKGTLDTKSAHWTGRLLWIRWIVHWIRHPRVGGQGAIGARWLLYLMLASSQTTSEHRCSGSSLRVLPCADNLQEERKLRFTDGWRRKQVMDRPDSFSLVLTILTLPIWPLCYLDPPTLPIWHLCYFDPFLPGPLSWYPL